MITKEHLLSTAKYKASPNQSGEIKPVFIVMHYTAGWTEESAIATLTNPNSNASAHVVVDWDGTITQLVPFNKKAWHAGPSRYEGYVGLNSYSIGIEIVNPGYLRKTTAGNFIDAYGRKHVLGQNGFTDVVEAPHPRVGSGTFYWPAYKAKQLDAVEHLSKLLIAEYNIRDIVSHEEIDTRGWKTDPGPAFPMNRFKALLRERGTGLLPYEVISDTPLNIRLGPGVKFKIDGEYVKGTIVNVEEFKGDWARISSSHWVHKAYLRKI